MTRAGLYIAAAGLAMSSPFSSLAAQDDAEPAFSLEGAVTLVSDYRFRGFSLSDKRPALQPEVWLNHESGFYAGVWGSTLAEYGGATVETDFTLGFAKSVGPVDLDVYATWYLYPGGEGVDYVEITSLISGDLGSATLGLELAYAPAQDNIGQIDNAYGAVHLSAPLADLPINAIGSIGVEDGAFGETKIDWSAGLTGEALGLELTAVYIAAARDRGDPLADPTVVLSVKKSF